MLRSEKPHFLRQSKPETEEPVTLQGAKLAASLGLAVTADNHFICPSTKDLWRVGEGGGVSRLSSEEVDHDEALKSAPKDTPEAFLASILNELEQSW